MSQRIAIYITDSSLPPNVLSTLPPNAVKGNIPILDDLVPTSDALLELRTRLTSQFPALSRFLHAFRFRVDEYVRHDLPWNDSVQDAVAGLPGFLKRQTYPRKATVSVKPDDPIDLRVITTLQCLEEIDKSVLRVEKAYWNHFAAIKYLESRPPPPSLPQNAVSMDRGSDETDSDDSVDTESDVSEGTDTDGADETDGVLDRSYDADATIQLWVKYMRSIKAELNRVPKDLSEKLLPFLREHLQAPPKGFTVLWESENRKFPSTGTMSVIGDLTGEERKAAYLRIKAAQLAEITEQEIREISEREEEIEGVRVSGSFVNNQLVEMSYGKMYPELTDKAVIRSLVAVWGMLTEEEKRSWRRRDAWELKQKGSNPTERDEREPVPAMQSTRVGRVSAVRIPPSDPSFTVTSGMIYWGHLGTIAHADVMPSSSIDGPQALPKRRTSGTIVQRGFRYRAHARNGTWKVAQVAANSSSQNHFGHAEEDMRRIGWIVYHESVDPGESVLRASGIYGGTSGNGDEGVLVVGRYDWSGYWAGPRDPAFASHFSSRFHNCHQVGESFDMLKKNHIAGHLAIIDAAGFSFDMLDCGMTARGNGTGRTELRRWDEVREWLFQSAGGTRFGVCVEDKNTEYEFAYLIYDFCTSPASNGTTPRLGYELVAILYDAVYHQLDGDRFMINGKLYPSESEVMVE
ncbi:hypothetical protein HDU93_008789 [Gonapodya sp. JEL0774]|nr:hypothetical protein HDU93_008789 [Gonapodya sp. JEL0774]